MVQKKTASPLFEFPSLPWLEGLWEKSWGTMGADLAALCCRESLSREYARFGVLEVSALGRQERQEVVWNT